MKPVMRYHGAKYRLAPWIMGFFPAHMTYVEPFGGAAGVLMQKPRSYSEVYNDLDGDVATVFKVLQNKEMSLDLERLLTFTPYSRDEFLAAFEPTECPIATAKAVLVRAYMGFGSAGATKNRTGFRSDSGRKYSTAAHQWPGLPLEIAKFHERLQGVIIENKPAIDVMANHDRPDTLFSRRIARRADGPAGHGGAIRL